MKIKVPEREAEVYGIYAYQDAKTEKYGITVEHRWGETMKFGPFDTMRDAAKALVELLEAQE